MDFRAAIWGWVRHEAEGSFLQRRTEGSNRQADGRLMTPSRTPSLSVARGEHGCLNSRKPVGRDEAFWIQVESTGEMGGVGHQASPVVGGRASEYPGVVLGKALSLHQALPASGGAAFKIRVGGQTAVVEPEQGFGLDGHQVDGAVGEVDDLFGVAESPVRIDKRAGVAGVGGCGGISAADGCGEAVVVDGAGKAAVADAEESSIPPVLRNPEVPR